jgi:hypothetical protein
MEVWREGKMDRKIDGGIKRKRELRERRRFEEKDM